MPQKFDSDTTSNAKLLKLFRKLMAEGKKHYLSDLAKEFNCSSQTILRLIMVIEAEIGTNLQTGKDGTKRWYQIVSIARSRLGLDFEELRYLAICRDLASPYLPEQVKKRVDESLLNFSLLMSDSAYAGRENIQKEQFAFFSKGYIDYTKHYSTIDKLLKAIDTKMICLIRYKAAGKSEIKEHRFAPHKFVSMSGTLYCLGATVESNYVQMKHYNSFPIHRIIDIISTDKPIKFDIPDVELNMFGLPWHEPRTFKIQFKKGRSSDYVRERIWAENQKMTELEDGGILLEITTRSEPELTAWVRSFGDEAKFIKE